MDEIKDMKDVSEENLNRYAGLTLQEARHRLKHIAGLCYALSCDISNLEIEAEYLRLENENLRQKLEAASVKQIPKAPESLDAMKTRITRFSGKHFEHGDHHGKITKGGGAPKGNKNARKRTSKDV